MTVKLEGSIKRFSGTSIDVKPRPYSQGGTQADGETLPAGSSFMELDTGRIYRWDGDGQWVIARQRDATQALLGRVIELLEEQNELLEVIASD